MVDMVNIVLASTGAASAVSGASGGAENGGMLQMILIFGGMGLVFYFMLIRPQNKKKKKEEAMRKNIEIGDDITTIGGIVGKIVAVKDDSDSFIIETGADRSKVKVKKWAIASVDNEKEQAKEKK